MVCRSCCSALLLLKSHTDANAGALNGEASFVRPKISRPLFFCMITLPDISQHGTRRIDSRGVELESRRNPRAT